ncbi:MAG: pantetheine-phosphate adenylyltransferase [Emcibacteraceae bacterium]|jgi:pantetheine-phosphate adenylyltransferase|nr:pantetheine-phosphate adenylyltransferase [Kordiimonadaceae bacterium]MDA9553520.1 pantetheine-phosphate adenylyltransferase [Emcibacteraceae bacterium]MDG1022195.1 pantetheine-phosphate adenylyltransferase [Emcibacteraceae bacterium]MDG1725786.1 pantetheine-phosphate adenylyltransferase [Emcibacteraceae bacterium]
MATQKRIGLYPGTFDPITLGHLDIIKRGASLVDHLIIGVSNNPAKNPLFSIEERIEMTEREMDIVADANSATIEVKPFNSLLMHFAEEVGASVIIRGLRATSDFEYEFQMTAMNDKLNPDVETVFLMADPSLQAIASRLVKEIAIYDGEIAKFVTPSIRKNVLKKLGKN